MNSLLVLIVYCGLIVSVSLVGGRLSSLLRMTHLRTQLLMSGVGGLMLGIAMLHLLPHAAETLASPSRAGMGVLAGLVVMFLLVRLFHTHDHGVLEHPHDPGDPAKGISWFGLFFGLLLHTLVDGIALSASVIAESEHGAWLGLGGLGTFLAVALHKPLDAFAITSVMNRQHWSINAQWVANVIFSLACPLGALAFYFGVRGPVANPALLGWGLAVSAGFFIGIAMADLLPEVAFHDHDRGKLTATFLLGVAIAAGIENLPGHSHDHGSLGADHHHHDDHGHDGHHHADGSE